MLTEEGRKKRAQQDAEIAARVEAFKAEQRELLRELAEVGVHVDMVNRLPNIPTAQYAQALPILFKHLQREYSDGTLASLARSLATKQAQQYWDEIVSMYRRAADPEAKRGSNVSMALAAAVAGSWPSSRLSDLIALLRDQKLPYRALLLRPIRSKRGSNRQIAILIEELKHDPALAPEINSWKILPSQAISSSH